MAFRSGTGLSLLLTPPVSALSLAPANRGPVLTVSPASPFSKQRGVRVATIEEVDEPMDQATGSAEAAPADSPSGEMAGVEEAKQEPVSETPMDVDETPMGTDAPGDTRRLPSLPPSSGSLQERELHVRTLRFARLCVRPLCLAGAAAGQRVLASAMNASSTRLGAVPHACYAAGSGGGSRSGGAPGERPARRDTLDWRSAAKFFSKVLEATVSQLGMPQCRDTQRKQMTTTSQDTAGAGSGTPPAPVARSRCI